MRAVASPDPVGIAGGQAVGGGRHAQLAHVAHRATPCQTGPMIKSIRHKGLARLYQSGSTSGVQATHVMRLRLQLAALDTAQVIEDLAIPGFGLHPLKGKLEGRWSIRVNGNWRLTFEFVDGNVHVLDYEDYH